MEGGAQEGRLGGRERTDGEGAEMFLFLLCALCLLRASFVRHRGKFGKSTG